MRLPFDSLKTVLSGVKYKQGWHLSLLPVEPYMYEAMNNLPKHALFLHSVAWVQNSRELAHRDIIPVDGGAVLEWPHTYDEFIEQIKATLKDDEAHEFNEFFRVNGALAHDMHDPVNDIGGPAVISRQGVVIARITSTDKDKRNEAFNSLVA